MLAETLPPPPVRRNARLCKVTDCGNAADVELSATRIHAPTRQVLRAGSLLCATCYLLSTPVARVA